MHGKNLVQGRPGFRKVGCLPQRLAILQRRAGEIPLLFQGSSEPIVRPGVTGSELEYRGKFPDGLVELPHSQQGLAQHEMALGKIRRQFYPGFQVFNSVTRLSDFTQRQAKVELPLWPIGRQAHCFGKKIGGALRLPHCADSLALLSVGPFRLTAFEAIMAFDGMVMGFAGVALVSFMSTLTSLGYTATQYALLTSVMTWTGKTSKGFSGVIVQDLQQGRAPLEGYALFFLFAGAVGLPAIVLCALLAWRTPPTRAAA